MSGEVKPSPALEWSIGFSNEMHLPDEIIKCGRKKARPLVVVEWKGSLQGGHAKILKGILAKTEWPILLTRQKSNYNTILKIKNEFRAA
jgi:hypothetical protein